MRAMRILNTHFINKSHHSDNDNARLKLKRRFLKWPNKNIP